MIYCILTYLVICILINFLFNYLTYWQKDPLDLDGLNLFFIALIWPVSFIIIFILKFMSLAEFISSIPYKVLVKFLGEPNDYK